MTIDKPLPDILHPKHTALDIAEQCTYDDDDFTYRAIPWGNNYWVVEVLDDIGVIGYL
jgi:hypothetical protein